jgi:peptidyl-prolyl cis-trans isomerase SurA
MFSMKVRSGTLAAFLLSLGIFQGCAPKYDDQIVLEVGQNKVTMRDYENFYLRNSSTLESAQKSSQAEREHFLDLLTNYKLKLQDAYDRHLLDDPEIMSELREYRSTLASTFLIEKDITGPGIRRLYDRRQKQVHVQQILLAMKPDASPADTLRIFTKATDIIRRAKAGENFDSLAIKYSEAPGVNTSHGDYYFITGGKLVAPFEDAIYSIQPGQIGSNPVRTPFGYHVVRVFEVEPTRSLKVRHIMARFQTTNPDSSEVAGALTRIKGIQDSLKKGWDFANLAMKLSEDGGSSGQGGDLGWFERARWVLPFDEAAFKLKQGQTSGIVRTPFGFHIIHCDSVRPLGSYAAMESELKKNYQQTRYNDDYTAYVDSLKREFAYSFHEDAFKELLSHVDSTKTTEDSAWDKNLTPEIRNTALMTIGGRSVSADTVIKILRNKPEFRSASLREGELRPHVDRIADAFLFEEKSLGLESRYPEFAALMKEYTDGIILYKLEQMEVWNRTSVSDSALRKYFAENGDKFMFPERLRIGEIYLEADTTALMIYDSLKHGADFTGLAAQWNEDPDVKSKSGEKGFVVPDTGEIARQAAALAIGEISEPFELDNGGYAIVKLIAKEPARRKSYDEAGAEVSNSYQEHQSKLLEQQWVDRVRQKFVVKQNKELLKNAFTSPQASGPP